MNGIIVLDGPDACGKTTLGKAIGKMCDNLDIPFQYQHSMYKFRKTMFCYHEAVVRRAIKHAQYGIAVIDRLHWSEFIYSKVYRGGSNWPLQWRYFDRLLQKHGALQVICVGDSAQQVADWHRKVKQEREEMYSVGMDAIAGEFLRIVNKNSHRRDFFHYNWEKHTGINLNSTVAMLLTEAAEIRKALPSNLTSHLDFTTLGSTSTAEYLFVGGKQDKSIKRPLWPMWGYQKPFLNVTQALDELDFDESLGLWVNFYDNTDSFYQLLEYNDKLKLIAIGARLGEILEKCGIRNRSIIHPKYTPSIPYITQIRNALKNARPI